MLFRSYISDLMNLTLEEREFLNRFEAGDFVPELVFEDQEILNRIKYHPMAIWKVNQSR